jgi:hypothetical protein
MHSPAVNGFTSVYLFLMVLINFSPFFSAGASPRQWMPKVFFILSLKDVGSGLHTGIYQRCDRFFPI